MFWILISRGRARLELMSAHDPGGMAVPQNVALEGVQQQDEDQVAHRVFL